MRRDGARGVGRRRFVQAVITPAVAAVLARPRALAAAPATPATPAADAADAAEPLDAAVEALRSIRPPVGAAPALVFEAVPAHRRPGEPA